MGQARDTFDHGLKVLLPDELIDNLLELLSQADMGVVQLLDQGECKSQALVDDDLGRLEQIVQTETALLKEFDAVESRRLHLSETIKCTLADLGVKDITPDNLKDLAPYVSPSRREKLLALGEELKAKLLKLQDINILNAELLTHSIALANFSLSLLTGETGPITYQRPGEKKAPRHRHSRLDARV